MRRWMRYSIIQRSRRKSLLRSSASYSRSQTKSACVEFAKVALCDARRCNLLNRRRVLRSVFLAWRRLATCAVKGSQEIGSHHGSNRVQNIVFAHGVAEKEASSVRLLSKPRLPVRNVYAVVDGRIVLNSGSEGAVANHAWEALIGPPPEEALTLTLTPDVASHHGFVSDVGTQQRSSKNDQKLQLVSEILHFIEEFKELLM